MTLAELGRTAALEKGWVLRHPFDSRNPGTPDAVFGYAPCNEEELECTMPRNNRR
jgi:hypothetical protein